MDIRNTYNFFEIMKSDKSVVFWGMDITAKKIPITDNITLLIKKLKLPFDEVIEIYEDDSYSFYKAIYENVTLHLG